MNKIAVKELARVLVDRHGLDEERAELFIQQMFDTLSQGLLEDKVVKVKGLGVFKVTAVAPRKSVDVNTGEAIIIEGRERLSFQPDAAMRDAVNRPFSLFETVILHEGVDFSEIDERYANATSLVDLLDGVLESDAEVMDEDGTTTEDKEVQVVPSTPQRNELSAVKPSHHETQSASPDEMVENEQLNAVSPTFDEVTSSEEVLHLSASQLAVLNGKITPRAALYNEVEKEKKGAPFILSSKQLLALNGLPSTDKQSEKSTDTFSVSTEGETVTPVTSQTHSVDEEYSVDLPLSNSSDDNLQDVEIQVGGLIDDTLSTQIDGRSEEQLSVGLMEEEEGEDAPSSHMEVDHKDVDGVPFSSEEKLNDIDIQSDIVSESGHTSFSRYWWVILFILFLGVGFGGAYYLMQLLTQRDNRIEHLESQVREMSDHSTSHSDSIDARALGVSRADSARAVAPSTVLKSVSDASHTDTTRRKRPAAAAVSPSSSTTSVSSSSSGNSVRRTQQTSPKSSSKMEVSPSSSSSFTLSAAAANDARIRTGAYRIIGIARQVTVRRGQTLSGISRAQLGPGMECYMEAVNDGRTEFKEGEKINVPVLQLKKK